MRLLVLGASGRTGHHVLARGLDQGHDVTALVRDASQINLRDEHLRVIVGSAMDPATIDEAVAGHDAVLCALGPGSVRELLRTELMRASVPSLVRAMERQDVPRLILLSALGAGESARCAPRITRVAFGSILRQVGRDKEGAERAVRASGLVWTIVYPPSLTEGPPTGTYRHGEELALRGSPRISRSDVAQFMLAELTDDRYVRKGAIVGP